MEEKTLPKTVSATLDLNEIDGDIEQLYLPLNAEEKRSITKKILGLPDSFKDTIDFQIVHDRISFFWQLPQPNRQAETLHKKAILYARKGNLQKALDYWNQAARLNPQDPDYFFNLGVAYFELKRYIESIDALTRTLAICPIYYKTHLILGTAYLKIRKFENAKKHIEKSLIVNKTNVLAFLNLGAVYSILRDYKNGIAMFEKAITLSPKEASAYMGLAKIYSTLENTEKANFYFQKVIQYDNKGNLANYAKRLIVAKKIERVNNKDIDVTFSNPEEYYSEGYRSYVVGNFLKAGQMYKKYLALKSNDDYVWCALGEAQLRAGKPELAAEAFKKAAKLSSVTKGLYFKELGIAFDRQEKYDKAAAAMSKAYELGKMDSVTYCIWGKALFELGNVPESIEKLEQSLKANKNNLLAKYYLALALAKDDQLDEAVEYLDEILRSKIDTPLKEKSEQLKMKILQNMV